MASFIKIALAAIFLSSTINALMKTSSNEQHFSIENEIESDENIVDKRNVNMRIFFCFNFIILN